MRSCKVSISGQVYHICRRNGIGESGRPLPLCLTVRSAKQRRSVPSAGLALSGASRQLPQRGSFFEKANFPVHPKPLTLGEVASRSDDGEGKPADGGAGPRFRSCFRWGCASVRQCQTKCAASCQRPRPLRRFAPAPPKGELFREGKVSGTSKTSHFGRGGIAKR